MGKNMQNPWNPQKMNRFLEKAKHSDNYQSIVDIFKFFNDKKNLSNGKWDPRANIYLLKIFHKLMILYFMSNNESIINFES